MTRRTRATLAGVVAAVAAVAAAVVVVTRDGSSEDVASGTGPDGPATDGAAPVVIPSAAGRPGTVLGDGFTVVDGTTLIGDPIPIGVAVIRDDAPIIDEGWTASSVIEGGDPLEVLDAYLRQAEAAGLERVSEPGCGVDRDVTICSSFARTPDPSSPRSFTAQVVRGRRQDVLSDHVVLRYATTDLFWEYGPMATGGAGAGIVPPAPTTWPPLAGPGEGIGTAGELAHDVQVQDGSRLAGPPHLNLDDATGGIEALLEVTGDPRTVLDTYLVHLGETAGHTDPEVRELGGAVVTTAFAGGGGGDGFDLTLVEREGRPNWLAISASHD